MAQFWRVGDLARATGVTVRALHHYDQLGLLVPSTRTSGGHRAYTGDDVRRLHHIVALRGFGLGLAEVQAALDDPVGLPELVERQLAVAEERVRAARRLRHRLLHVRAGLRELTEPSTAEFVALIEETVTMNQPLTPEQVAKLTAERQAMMAQLTPEQIEQMNQRRRDAVAALSPAELDEMRQRRREMMPPS
ncbi:MerR family transcriptional regulator [Actinokineospora inagensis]|uniref:MerR family transcriptional regulator n=1 Tax=Actinokineospora inagensis TaxID=103730 RepID=UPI0004796C70|nr:MerR family transcriptional regulator [Actinokineospora inagensis]